MNIRNILITCLSLFVFSCSSLNFDIPKGPFDTKGIKDGTYTGKATWRRVNYAEVEIEVENNKIVDIQILKHRHGPKKAYNAEGIIPRILEQQSTQVDVISGATYSSKVICAAVQDAINNAGTSPD